MENLMKKYFQGRPLSKETIFALAREGTPIWQITLVNHGYIYTARDPQIGHINPDFIAITDCALSTALVNHTTVSDIVLSDHIIVKTNEIMVVTPLHAIIGIKEDNEDPIEEAVQPPFPPYMEGYTIPQRLPPIVQGDKLVDINVELRPPEGGMSHE